MSDKEKRGVKCKAGRWCMDEKGRRGRDWITGEMGAQWVEWGWGLVEGQEREIAYRHFVIS